MAAQEAERAAAARLAIEDLSSQLSSLKTDLEAASAREAERESGHAAAMGKMEERLAKALTLVESQNRCGRWGMDMGKGALTACISVSRTSKGGGGIFTGCSKWPPQNIPAIAPPP